MKKLILTLLSVLLLALPVQAAQTVHRHLEPETLVYDALSGAAQTQFATNESIIAIKFRSGITLSSLTLNMSTTATGPITGSSVDLRPYSSTIWGSTALAATVSDGTNTFTLTPGAAGTGETLSAEQITDWTNRADLPYSTFVTSGKDITSAISAGTAQAYTNAVFTLAGRLYLINTDLAVNSGPDPLVLSAGAAPGFLPAGTDFFLRWDTGAHTLYHTQTVAGETLFMLFSDTASNFSAENSIKYVLTSDALGMAFTNGTAVGAFNANLANRGPYSITITKAP